MTARTTTKTRPPTTGWLVYLLRCRDGSLYTGITNNLSKRLAAHAAGKASRYTRSRLPVTLAYTEPQATRSRALKREAAIKKLSRRQKDNLIGGPPTIVPPAGDPIYSRRHASAGGGPAKSFPGGACRCPNG